MKCKPLIYGLFPLLTGCGFTPQGDALRLAVKEYGAQAADAELENLEWAICNGVSVGAIKRRYGPHKEKFEGWRQLCAGAELPEL